MNIIIIMRSILTNSPSDSSSSHNTIDLQEKSWKPEKKRVFFVKTWFCIEWWLINKFHIAVSE